MFDLRSLTTVNKHVFHSDNVLDFIQNRNVRACIAGKPFLLCSMQNLEF